jgi:hypothetical protein
VSLTAPASETSVRASATVTISANAGDNDGSVAQVARCEWHVDRHRPSSLMA